MLRIYSILAASVISFTACKEKAAPKSEPVNLGEGSAAAKPFFAVPDTFKAVMGRIYEGYFGIQEALAQDDFGKATQAFSSMHGLIHSVPKDVLDGSARAAWDSSDARMMASLHPMAASKDIESFRSHFSDFSDTMVEVIGNFGTVGDRPIYQIHCPMARENRGADWLQKGREISNPYFGASMQQCGELVRTLSG